MDANAKIEAARELLTATKQSLQLVGEQIAILQQGRVAVAPADDVSTEHRPSFLGALDDSDGSNGILFTTALAAFGFQNPRTGTIRNQEDAAFVCTQVLVALKSETSGSVAFVEDMFINGDGPDSFNPMLRLTDANTGRTLIAGNAGVTGVPVPDNMYGAVPFSYISSFRPGLGSNVKNKLFSEFTIPRSGPVKVEVFNVGLPGSAPSQYRAFVSLLGYKVYGG